MLTMAGGALEQVSPHLQPGCCAGRPSQGPAWLVTVRWAGATWVPFRSLSNSMLNREIQGLEGHNHPWPSHIPWRV